MQYICSLTYISYLVSHHVFVVVDSGEGNLLLLGAGRHHKQPLDKGDKSSSGHCFHYRICIIIYTTSFIRIFS